ncbi:MAG: hypothetical protein HWE15_06980 [Algoriphagus sp.]|uniref:hypothetical protein n=1 Tax=Algoriphagus sp. TaxID=1872435 RepID=UPI0018210A50|nr:hypothetical protein [Algoriphagus sp.]NVJ86031.1 hypothetical protein [Algoriphagus sp.]
MKSGILDSRVTGLGVYLFLLKRNDGNDAHAPDGDVKKKWRYKCPELSFTVTKLTTGMKHAN